MLKRTTLALLCTAAAGIGVAYADTDTKPVLVTMTECNVPHGTDPVDVKVRFKITETGALEDFSVVKSSGDNDIDQRVIKCVSGFTYKPATHNGVAVAAYDTHDYSSAFIQDMTGDRKAFALLERDADRRCRKLFPIDARFDLPGQPITIVGVARLASGEVQTNIIQSAGPKPDTNAAKCLTAILSDHPELPATFVRGIAVNWSHR